MTLNLFRKYKSLYSSTSNSFSTGTGETITPNSVVGLPTDTEITLTFDRLDSIGTETPTKTERIIGTISGSNFVVRSTPTSGRGADGTTEQAHTSPVVEMIWNAKDLNDIVDGILVGHGQNGLHNFTQVVDSNGNEVVKLGSTASAVNEITLTNNATNNNPIIAPTGGDTNIGLDIKPKGTGVIRAKCTVSIQVVNTATAFTTGDGKFFFRIPAELNGMNLTAVAACVYTVGTTGTTDIQIRNKTDSVDFLSTKITIDSGETDTLTAATPAVIDTAHDDVATADVIAIDVDAISTTAAKGLVINLTFSLP